MKWLRPPSFPGGNTVSRRQWLRRSARALAVAATAGHGLALPGCGTTPAVAPRSAGFYRTRGVVLLRSDLESYDWPALAAEVRLNTIATHMRPSEIEPFLRTEAGQRFQQDCRRRGLRIEHESHAMSDLLPRALFNRDPTLFRMDENGQRVRDHNLCVHSNTALEVVAENAAHYTDLLRSDTHRYFYWLDDAVPMCRCAQCRGYSDSDQAVIVENRILQAIRSVDPRATLAHLAYAKTLQAPTQVKPSPGIFLEYAPIERRYDAPFRRREVQGQFREMHHAVLLDALDANLAWFGARGSQALEYWLDVSRFARWKREGLREIPWDAAVFADDLRLYANRGVRHITTFAAWLDADYARRWGVNPVRAYGAGFSPRP